MNLSKNALAILLAIVSINFSTAQNSDRKKEGEHEHNNEHLHAYKNELGMANAPVYFVKHKIITYGLHLHYIRNIFNRIGVGVGYERIFDEHAHQTISVVGQYHATDRLIFTVSPGFVFEENEINTSTFAFHFETSYEFEINNFHVGPLFELAYDPKDIHISLGLHTAIGF